MTALWVFAFSGHSSLLVFTLLLGKGVFDLVEFFLKTVAPDSVAEIPRRP